MSFYSAVLDKLDDAIFLRKFHGFCTMFWVPFTLFAHLIGWLESVKFVSLVSMIALFLGSFSSWQASRAEVKIDKQDNTAKLK
jgi:hypothetical protein